MNTFVKISFIMLFFAYNLNSQTFSKNYLDNSVLYYSKPDSMRFELFPRIKVGLSLPLYVNLTSGSLKKDEIDVWCCNDMDVSSLAFSSGINLNSDFLFRNLKIPNYLDSISFGASLNITYYTSNIHGSVEEPPRLVYLNDTPTNLYEESVFTWNRSLVSVSLGFIVGTSLGNDPFKYSDQPFISNYFLTIGPYISILSSQFAEHNVSVIRPDEFVYLDGNKSKVIKTKEISTANSLLYGFDFNFTIEYHAKQIINDPKFQNLLFSAKIGSSFDFGSPINNSAISQIHSYLMLGLKYQLYRYEMGRIQSYK